MFNKNAFKIRLEFFIKHWHSMGKDLIDMAGNQDAEEVSNFLWEKALTIMWENRNDDCIYYGIDHRDQYISFVDLLTVGVNQMNQQIQLLVYLGDTPISQITKINLIINEQVAILADEIEELLNEANHESTAK